MSREEKCNSSFDSHIDVPNFLHYALQKHVSTLTVVATSISCILTSPDI